MPTCTESVVEQTALAWLESAGWQVRNGAEIAPGESAAERAEKFIGRAL
jgi:type I restriction enzyme R subunit